LIDTSLFIRIQDSFYASAGEIVFGMSDGAVSIFGLVLGVAAGADSGNVVLLAGATGAIAATVSMMAGVFLELESEHDEVKVEDKRREAEIKSDPGSAVSDLIDVLKTTGLSRRSLDSIQDDMTADPMKIPGFEKAIACQEETPGQKSSPVAHACWMGISDFIAGITPVVPFAFLPFETARIACIAATAFLLLVLGIGRARFGNRPVARTVLETMGIATAAALAGVFIGRLIS
jgi:vacuolar iron transporter family protein